MTRSTATLVITICAALARTAAADDPKVEAEKRVSHAMALYEQGKYAEALKELTTAYALDPQPELIYAIAQAHVALGQCADAKTFYERFLTSKPGREAEAVVKEAIKGCKPATARVEPPPVPPVEPPPPPPERIDTLPPITTPPSPWYTDKLGGVLVVGGVAAAVVGGVFFQRSSSARDDADLAMTYPEYATHMDDAQSARRTSVVFGACGAALIVAGVVRYVLRDPGPEQPGASVTGIVPTRHGAVATLGWRF